VAVSFEIRDSTYDGPDARALIEQVQSEYVVRYGGPDSTPVEPDEFAPPGGRFLVGYLDGRPVAMGGLRRHVGPAEPTVEIKRMYVAPGLRGRGLARALLAALEDAARSAGATRVILETGQRQPEAIRLYESSGYERIEGFGHYRCAPLSISYAKPL
jgi:GNAT superfamily N-acetyltransferase